MKRVKIGVGFGLWRLGMPAARTIVEVAERAEQWAGQIERIGREVSSHYA